LFHVWRRQGIDVDSNISNKPALLAAYLASAYLPSTAATYMKIARSMYGDIGNTQQWKAAMAATMRRAAEMSERPLASKPATPTDVLLLCGSLTMPEQRCILLMFITAARFSETRDRVVAGQVTFRTHEKHVHSTPSGGAFLELRLRCHKAATQGQRPFSRWIDCSNIDLSVFDDHHLQRQTVYDYIKRMCPHLSVHSLRKGAMQWLADAAVAAGTIAKLSGHQMASQVRSAAAYIGTRPDQPETRQVMAMSTMLLGALLRCGLRLPQPRRKQ
jgi:hypothetical protein